MRKSFLILSAILAVAAIAPAAASASTASYFICDFVSLCGVGMRADPGETNDVRVTLEEGGTFLIEDTAGIKGESTGEFFEIPCGDVTPTSVRCPALQSGPSRVGMQLDDGNDTVTVKSKGVGVAVAGGTGDDRVFGSDTSDFLTGNAGADTLIGGAGHDTMAYTDRQSAVKVRVGKGAVSGNAADGPAGQRDTIDASVEEIDGGAGDDLIKGTDGINWLYGNGGDDKLIGLGGKDLFGGGDGDDFIDSRAHDKEAYINCGPGYDKARIDRRDPEHATCERIKAR